MIYLLTSRKDAYNEQELNAEDIYFGKASEFCSWLDSYDNFIQLDSETNIVQGVYGWKGYLKGKNKDFEPILDDNGNRIPQKRECYLVQVGDYEGNTQWLFDTYEMQTLHKRALEKVLLCENQKLIHNALFDYTVFKWCFNIGINKIVDTMLMSKIITTGLEVGKDLPARYNSLAGCAERYLGIDLSKEEQTTFTNAPFTIEQLKYAAKDVIIPGLIYPHLKSEIDAWDLENVLTLECALLRSYGDAMIDNLYLEPEEWKANMEIQNEKVRETEAEFYNLMQEYFSKELQEPMFLELRPNPKWPNEGPEFVEYYLKPFVQKEDQYNFNWNSSKMRKNILKYLYPTLPENASTAKDYKIFFKYLLELNDETIDPIFLNSYLNKNYEFIEAYLIKHHTEFLLKENIFIPKGSILMNLNSPEQKLALFKLIKSNIKSVDKEILRKIDHPLARKLEEYNKAAKLSTSYGQNFLDAIDPDGMFRVKDFTQILSTGRSSMKLLQLLPGQKSYRNPFKPNNPKTGTRDDGHEWVVVGADYASQELCVLATFANEPVMIEALEKGYDLHSINTARLFPEKWASLGGEKEPKGKPEDKILQKLRNDTKSTIFGICYGKSSVGLGSSLNIPGSTEDLLLKYSEEASTYLKNNREDYLAYCRNTGIGKPTNKNKHDWFKAQHKLGLFLPEIITGDDMIDKVFKALPKMAEFLEESSLEGLQNKYIRTPDIIGRIRRFVTPENSKAIGEIKRAAQNFKIQSSSANMTKYAICIIKNYIEQNNLEDKMKFCLPLHDEIRYIARKDFADEALKIIVSKMEEAGEFILGNNLQKTEGEITAVWEK